jgi:hypothetical protein
VRHETRKKLTPYFWGLDVLELSDSRMSQACSFFSNALPFDLICAILEYSHAHEHYTTFSRLCKSVSQRYSQAPARSSRLGSIYHFRSWDAVELLHQCGKTCFPVLLLPHNRDYRGNFPWNTHDFRFLLPHASVEWQAVSIFFGSTTQKVPWRKAWLGIGRPVLVHRATALMIQTLGFEHRLTMDYATLKPSSIRFRLYTWSATNSHRQFMLYLIQIYQSRRFFSILANMPAPKRHPPNLQNLPSVHDQTFVRLCRKHSAMLNCLEHISRACMWVVQTKRVGVYQPSTGRVRRTKRDAKECIAIRVNRPKPTLERFRIFDRIKSKWCRILSL